MLSFCEFYTVCLLHIADKCPRQFLWHTADVELPSTSFLKQQKGWQRVEELTSLIVGNWGIVSILSKCACCHDCVYVCDICVMYLWMEAGL